MTIYCEYLCNEIVDLKIAEIVGKMSIGGVRLGHVREPKISNDVEERLQAHEMCGLHRTSCKGSMGKENRLHGGFIVIISMILNEDVSAETLWTRSAIPLTPLGM